MNTRSCLGLIAALTWLPETIFAAAPPVVINEIMYNSPKPWTNVQWIEIHNHGPAPAQIGRWKVSGSVEFEFPADTSLAPNGFYVIASDASAFEKAYKARPNAVFSKRLERDNGVLQLLNPAGESVDRVKYKDRERWPAAADGESSSLERIHPPGSSKAGNWGASAPTAARAMPGGTPGGKNSLFSDKPVPEIRRAAVSAESVRPGEKFRVSAEVAAPGGVASVVARLQLIGSGEPSESTLELKSDGKGGYSGEVATPQKPALYRIRLEAVAANGARRSHPDPAEIHPSMHVLVRPDEPRGKLDLAYIFNGSSPGEEPGRNGPSKESQLVWRNQQRIQMEANPYTLVGAIALTNVLEPGQFAKLRPVLKKAFERRNALVNDLYESADLEKVARETTARIQEWRKEFQNELRPILNPAQITTMENWAKAASPNRRGVDPSQLLSMWLNIDQMAFSGIAHTKYDEAVWEKARKALLDGMVERAKLAEPAKTAFESEESRSKFEASMGQVREKLMANLEKVVPQADLESATSFPDATQEFRERSASSTADKSKSIPGAFVHVRTDSGETVVFDHAEIARRNAGWKVHLAPGDLYHGMSSFNLIFEYVDRFVMAEPLAFDLYRRAGNAAPATEFVRLYVDGAAVGYHLLVEQPNRRFLSRNGLDPNGTLYKITWRGDTLEQTHERKSPGTGHADLKDLVSRLEAKPAADQWKNIRESLDLPQVLTYFAVNSVLGHWDGYMNNYFIFKDTQKSQRWTMYPWDQDKTFGFHDGLRGGEVFTDMPVNLGASGDKPPGWKKATPPRNFFEVYRINGPQWWRQPGPISGPVLSNPEARKHYAARIRHLLNNEFSAARMSAEISAMGNLLREEVEFRARAKGESPANALETHEGNIRSLKQFVLGRRDFLLAQDEIKNAIPWNPESLK